MLLAAALIPSVAAAQNGGFDVAVKGGATIERSEDDLRGTAPAVGLTASIPWGARWRGEVEFWLPAYLDDAGGEPYHRDVLLSASAIRPFQWGRVRPFVGAGLSLSRTETRSTTGIGVVLLTSAGVRVPISDRVSLVADVRLNLAPASVLVRPGAGIAFGF